MRRPLTDLPPALGVFGLRRGKRSDVPTFYLRKYAVCASRGGGSELTSELKSEQVLAAFVREGRPVSSPDAASLALGSVRPAALSDGAAVRASAPARVAGRTVLPAREAAPLELQPLSRCRTQAPSGVATPTASAAWVAASLPSGLGSLRPTPFDEDAWLPVPSGRQVDPGRAERRVPAPPRSQRRPSAPLIPREDPGAPAAPRIDWPTRPRRLA